MRQVRPQIVKLSNCQLGNVRSVPGYVYVSSSAPDAASSIGNQNADAASGPGCGSTAACVRNTNGVTSIPFGPDVNGCSVGKLPSGRAPASSTPSSSWV